MNTGEQVYVTGPAFSTYACVCVCVCIYSGVVAKLCLTLATPWTVAYSPYNLSMGFSRQEYWNGLPFPSPGTLPVPGIKPGFPALQADSLLTEL